MAVPAASGGTYVTGGPRVPLSTYRLQFEGAFGFDDARSIVPYLRALGIGDLYASPILKARKGSKHGYDVTDPSQLNPELGGAEGFEAMGRALAGHGMGLLLDVVPNHMAASSENPWWRDVLANGRYSEYASFFDIDWDAHHLAGRVLLPALGDVYSAVLERGEIRLAHEDAGLVLRYYEAWFPVDPASYRRVVEPLAAALPAGHPVLPELSAVAAAARRLPGHKPAGPAGPPGARRRAKRAAEVRRRFEELLVKDSDVAAALEAFLDSVNAGGWASLEFLDGLLDDQAFELVLWKLAGREVNYRRFFDVSDLAALRSEDPRVLDATHALVLRLVAEGRVTGLRIDHIDGLWDPLGYLRFLQERAAPRDRRPRAAAPAPAPGRTYVVVEKILSPGEVLPEDWPADGPTGYEFLAQVNGLFVDAPGAARVEQAWRRFTGFKETFAQVAARRKRLVLETLFGGELESLLSRLHDIAHDDRRGRDLPETDLREALIEVTAGLPVYRTYVREGALSDDDRRFLRVALEAAASSVAPFARPAVDFLGRVLHLDVAPRAAEGARALVGRWQQLTGPVTAKGVEDTALYLFTPLASLAEVGQDPGLRPPSPAAFHRHMRDRCSRWPRALNATSTHDTKRGEDLRARIDVLSEMPDRWAATVARWARWNARHRGVLASRAVPEPLEEWLIYQTLAGAWPLPGEESEDVFVERVTGYIRKVLREGKSHSSWMFPNEAYEDAVLGFLTAILDGSNERFRTDLARTAGILAWHGMLNSLAQLVLKVACPGVPDFYQGTELWSPTLVDPDNRRPVDFALRAAMLGKLEGMGDPSPAVARRLLASWEDGLVKLHVTRAALHLRRRRPEVFLEGDYRPIRARGTHARRVCSFARGGGDVVAVVPRLTRGIARTGVPPTGARWKDTALTLPGRGPGAWRNVFTGETVRARGRDLPLADVLRSFPVALLESS